jgi:2-polyprenyl-3-methyl-5-hydroxy-6-metoxy-1,4-benzoquinol methylase
MALQACRVCGQKFFKKPLLRYANMPKAAQKFPAAGDLADEIGVDLDVCQCTGCGLVQLSNMPVPYYREVIRAAAVSVVMRDFKIAQFSQFLKKHYLYGRKIIEIGCGCGEFLSLLSPLDVDAYGLEYSENAVAQCMGNGLKVEKGYLATDHSILANGPFDAFLFLMFLEHMPEPNVALRAIYNNITENAVGLIEVPNFEMVLRKKLFSEFIGDHLLYFTRETLQTTLQLNGFEVIEVDEVRDAYVLSVVVKKRSMVDISSFNECQAKIKSELNAYISSFKGKGVAIWGAGHQALAIIAMTGIQDRIRYVVDSAFFKQGKCTPATHLPVFSPDALRADPVDAVIVMAASYSDEVVGILRTQFPKGMHISVLRESRLESVEG